MQVFNEQDKTRRKLHPGGERVIFETDFAQEITFKFWKPPAATRRFSSFPGHRSGSRRLGLSRFFFHFAPPIGGSFDCNNALTANLDCAGGFAVAFEFVEQAFADTMGCAEAAYGKGR
jgi:hypothetical protein